MDQFAALIAHYGLLVVFIGVLLDQAGPSLPSYPILLAAGALAAGGHRLPVIIAVAATAVVSADLLWYAAGARFGRRILSLMCRLTLSPDACVRRTETTFERFGPWTLPIAKFVPGLSYVAVAMSGITRMRLLRFVAFDAIGAVLYVSVPIVLGSIFHSAVYAVLDTLVRLGGYGLALVIALFVAYIAIRWLDRRAFARRLKMARISVPELAALMDGETPPTIFDVRPRASREQDGIIPGAIAAHATDLAALTSLYPRDAEIVIYCACPNEASAAVAALHLRRAGFSNIRPLLGGIDAWRDAGRPVVLTGRPETDYEVAVPAVPAPVNAGLPPATAP